MIAIVTNRNARPTCIPPRSAVEGLMHHCWQATPCLRPNGFDPVVKRLANLMSVDGDPREIGAGPGDAHAPLPVNSPQGEAQNAGQHRSMEQRTWDQARGHQRYGSTKASDTVDLADLAPEKNRYINVKTRTSCFRNRVYSTYNFGRFHANEPRRLLPLFRDGLPGTCELEICSWC